MFSDPFTDADSRLDALVRPADWQNPQPAERYHLVVIGAGTAGLVAAASAASLGARVALIERDRMGGDCLNHGCVPSKALLASARAAAAWRAAVASQAAATQAAASGSPADGGPADGSSAAGFPAADFPAADFPAADFPAVMRRMRELRSRLAPNDSAQRFQGLGVDVFFGTARFVDRQTVGVGDIRLRFRRAVIATGARAAVPSIPGLAAAEPLTNESLFALEQLPPRLAILGAGPIGCEMAQAFARFGAAVVVIESGSGVLPREDRDAGAVIEQALRSDGVRFRLSATVARVAAAATMPSDKSKPDALKPDALKPDALKLDGPYPAFSELSQASGAGIRAAPTGWTLYGQGPQGAWEETVDRILVATGRRPNIEGLELEAAGIASGPHGVRVDDFLRTANRRVYAAGDVCSPYRFTHAADFMARAVVRNALFLGRARLSELVIPWCTYTDPEVAHVGLCEQQAVEAGIAVDVLVQPLAEVDRAILEAPPFAFTGRAGSALSDGPAGFVKVLLRRGTDRIVGATLVAPHAGEMVGELTLAIRQRLGIGELGNTIHPYPTVADAIRKLGDQYQRRRLTPRVRLLFRRWFDWWR